MNLRLRETLLVVRATVVCLSLGSAAAHAAEPASGLPLSGPAYRFADESYRAYAAGDFDIAVAKAREAIRQRPDDASLRTLLARAEAARAASRRRADAPATAPANAVARPGAPRHAHVSPPSGRARPSMDTAAYAAAARAYASYDDGRYDKSIDAAHEAVRLAPDDRRYRLLLGNALLAAGRPADALRAIDDGILRAGDDGTLAARGTAIRAILAQDFASDVYPALAHGDIERAIAKASDAVRMAPTNARYRLLLLDALLRGGRFGDAERVAGETLGIAPDDPTPHVLRAYARHRLGRIDDARADLDAAVRKSGVSPRGQRDLRLIAVDEALAGKAPQRAADLLQGLADDSADDAAPRLRAARDALAGRAASWSFVAPVLDCTRTDGPERCAIAPGPPIEPGFEAAAAAYSAFDSKDYALAAREARRAVEAAPSNRDDRALLVVALAADGRLAEAEDAATRALQAIGEDARLLAMRGLLRARLGQAASARTDLEAALRIGDLPPATEVDVLIALGRRDEARSRYDRVLAESGWTGLSDVDLAFLAARVGDDREALRAFERADAAGRLQAAQLQDAAFAAQRLGDDARALSWFERSIDATAASDTTPTPAGRQALFDTRRAVSDLSRRTGVFASLIYGGAVSGAGVASGGGNHTVQAGVEGYWRPFGYNDGRYVELFARAFETLYSEGQGDTGTGTAQAAVGVRAKPFKSLNVVASFSRVISASDGQDDWLAQLGYSGGSGTDLRVDVPAWWTTRVFVEGGRYLSSGQTYALAHAEAGRSLAPGDPASRVDGGWVLFPHVAIAADHDSTAGESNSAGIGPGIAARYWFRADATHAPRSYLDLSLEYRWRLAGSERAKGPFATMTLSY